MLYNINRMCCTIRSHVQCALGMHVLYNKIVCDVHSKFMCCTLKFCVLYKILMCNLSSQSLIQCTTIVEIVVLLILKQMPPAVLSQ